MIAEYLGYEEDGEGGIREILFGTVIKFENLIIASSTYEELYKYPTFKIIQDRYNNGLEIQFSNAQNQVKLVIPFEIFNLIEAELRLLILEEKKLEFDQMVASYHDVDITTDNTDDEGQFVNDATTWTREKLEQHYTSSPSCSHCRAFKKGRFDSDTDCFWDSISSLRSFLQSFQLELPTTLFTDYNYIPFHQLYLPITLPSIAENSLPLENIESIVRIVDKEAYDQNPERYYVSFFRYDVVIDLPPRVVSGIGLGEDEEERDEKKVGQEARIAKIEREGRRRISRLLYDYSLDTVRTEKRVNLDNNLNGDEFEGEEFNTFRWMSIEIGNRHQRSSTTSV